MSDTIEVLNSVNNINISTSVNKIVTQIEKNVINLSETKNYIELEPIINLLQVIQNNTEIVVNNSSSLIQVIEQAKTSISVSNITNKIDVLEKLSQISLTVEKNVIEFNEDTVTISVPIEDVDEAKIMYKKRVDFLADGVTIYKGYAEPGSLETAAVWRISKVVFDEASNDDVEEDFANGNDTFTNIWTDRLVLSYG